ncbi:hypothetical protein ACFQ1E_07715 [Sphingomonas canadensis]|uniref:Lysine transporter LysE n=1 Tax=Sphingomonas canadensis TaxID=1219257 RepID=A0ABW3H5S7_9SPHN|nr:hypothetical protein [Sphingomonas canadensis]MCW3835922.1 hypothetical protein [Sphingomonas canadensis]
MSAFEFTFSLFGLLLGFSLVEVMSGLVRTLKLRGAVRIGWVTPLLGLFVMVDLVSFWSAAWQIRDLVPANFGVLLLGLAITGVYYFAASMVFPDDPADWPDFDLWAERYKRRALGGVFAANLMATVAMFSQLPPAMLTPAALGMHGGLLAVMAAAAVVKPHWATGLLLGAILAFYFLFSVLQILG